MRELVKNFLKQQDWQFSEIEENNFIIFGISGDNGNFQCVIDVIEDEYKLIFFSICGSNVPFDKRKEILDFINRWNYKIFMGNFIMDPENGEIRFRTSITYEFIKPSLEIVEQVIILNLVTMDKSLPGLMGIMFGDLSAEKAIELIEPKSNSASID